MGLWYWMMWMFWVFLAIVCAMWCGAIADGKGYSRVLFTILGFFFIIFTLIVVFVLPARQTA
jgi:hypothetical protein